MASAGQESDTDPNLFRFKDEATVPDPILDYPDSLRQSAMPLVIDNGSFKCRVGWADNKEPNLIFKNVIAKQRNKKDIEVQIGNDIGNIEVVRWQLKSQHDRNVVTHYDAQEQLFDYAFNHMGINTENCVDHPLVLTESVANPNYCRHQMSELLFECYHIPKVVYGVDSLFSWYKNHPKPDQGTGLVVSCGYQSTHIIPVLNGRIETQFCRRMNFGGCQVDNFMQRMLQLKYPGHYASVSLGRAEELIKSHCELAINYADALKKWRMEDYYLKEVHKFQLPFTPLAASIVTAEQQKERRDQQVRRLKELNAKRRQEKIVAEQEKLKHLMEIQEMIEDEDEDTISTALAEHDIDSTDELPAMMMSLTNSIQKLRFKILAEEAEAKGEEAYNLLSVPDETLSEDQREQKKRQRIMKSVSESQAKKIKTDKKNEMLQPPADKEAQEAWLENLRQQRQLILDKRMERKQRKQDMTKRRTQASQQRMKIITELAQGTRKKKEDTFGQNDDDWNVYKAINKDAGDSDSEAEQEKLDECDTLLREYDPKFQKEDDKPFDVAEYYKLHVGVERIRAPELLFQPSMIGIEQAGIAETMDFVLKKFPTNIQQELVNHVFITGGCGTFPNFAARLERELLEMRPFQSTFKVYTASNPVLDSWYGACQLARSPAFASCYMTKADYEEKGTEYLKESTISNRFYPTPKGEPDKQ